MVVLFFLCRVTSFKRADDPFRCDLIITVTIIRLIPKSEGLERLAVKSIRCKSRNRPSSLVSTLTLVTFMINYLEN